MRNKSVRRSLVIMCLLIVAISVLVIGSVSVYSIKSMSKMANNNYESAMLDGYNSEIKAEVQSVRSV